MILPHHGTDGRENQWEDQLLLNYRDIDVWYLFLDEIKSLIDLYQIDGIHIHDAQSGPIILRPNVAELFKRDPDSKK